MSRLAEPHAGVLVNRLVEEEDAAALRERAGHLPQLTLALREVTDLELIATGAASPLEGFMGRRDYRSVLATLRLTNGTPWPVPFTLAVTIAEMATALRHRAAALHDAQGRLRAVIEATDAYGRDAFLQAIVLKNFGAREVLFECDRADWLAVSPDLAPEDLGLAPVWVLSAGGRRPRAEGRAGTIRLTRRASAI